MEEQAGGEPAVLEEENIVNDVKEEPQAEEVEQTTEPEEQEVKRKRLGGYQRKLAKKDAEIAELNAKLEAVAPDEEQDAPSESDYEDWDTYQADLVKYQVSETLKVERQKTKEQSIRNEHEALAVKYQDDLAKLAEKNPDVYDVIDGYDAPWNPQIRQALLESDKGAEVAYYLAKNLNEADKMEGMTFSQVNRFIGGVEARLSHTPKKATRAPAPIAPVGNTSSMGKNPYKQSLSYEEQQEWRKRNKT